MFMYVGWNFQPPPPDMRSVCVFSRVNWWAYQNQWSKLKVWNHNPWEHQSGTRLCFRVLWMSCQPIICNRNVDQVSLGFRVLSPKGFVVRPYGGLASNISPIAQGWVCERSSKSVLRLESTLRECKGEKIWILPQLTKNREFETKKRASVDMFLR